MIVHLSRWRRYQQHGDTVEAPVRGLPGSIDLRSPDGIGPDAAWIGAPGRIVDDRVLAIGTLDERLSRAMVEQVRRRLNYPFRERHVRGMVAESLIEAPLVRPQSWCRPLMPGYVAQAREAFLAGRRIWREQAFVAAASVNLFEDWPATETVTDGQTMASQHNAWKLVGVSGATESPAQVVRDDVIGGGVHSIGPVALELSLKNHMIGPELHTIHQYLRATIRLDNSSGTDASLRSSRVNVRLDTALAGGEIDASYYAMQMARSGPTAAFYMRRGVRATTTGSLVVVIADDSVDPGQDTAVEIRIDGSSLMITPHTTKFGTDTNHTTGVRVGYNNGSEAGSLTTQTQSYGYRFGDLSAQISVRAGIGRGIARGMRLA